MVIELFAVYLVVAIAGVWAVDKGVELKKTDLAMESQKYTACVKAAENVAQCTNLE